MTRHGRWVGTSEIVAEFGFTARHWNRMAAAGRVPGARQPFGPRSSWMFDLDAVRAWWAASEKTPEALAVPQVSRTRPRRVRVQFERIDLKKTLAKVLAEHPQNRKR